MSQTHNRPKTPTEIEIAPGYPIEKYLDLKEQRNYEEISALIRTRFDDRFFSPLGYSLIEGRWTRFGKATTKASGWLIVSVACLAIESVIGFKKGLVQDPDAGKHFTEYFEANAPFAQLLQAFPAFKKKMKNGALKEDNKFYSNIRCGLLHQGETKEGWRLLLGKEGDPMVDPSTGMKCIFAKPILAGVGNTIREYCSHLAADTNFTTDRAYHWGQAIRKLDAIAKRCGVEASALGKPIKLKRESRSH